MQEICVYSCASCLTNLHFESFVPGTEGLNAQRQRSVPSAEDCLLRLRHFSLSLNQASLPKRFNLYIMEGLLVFPCHRTTFCCVDGYRTHNSLINVCREVFSHLFLAEYVRDFFPAEPRNIYSPPVIRVTMNLLFQVEDRCRVQVLQDCFFTVY